jgi:hypothetical protein
MWKVSVFLLVVRCYCASYQATWINVWLNHNQSYVPGPNGLASNGIKCAWDVAKSKYNISFPAGTNMSLDNVHAIDWVGGAGFGNMYVYLKLIEQAGINVVIPDFTNGFSNANSFFPVVLLHEMVARHFPDMKIAYATSSGGVKSADAYLTDEKSDTSNYLSTAVSDGQRPVLIAYCVYADYLKLTRDYPQYKIIFANGESTHANKGGWHSEPYNGMTVFNQDVFWVAPSLDWQTGTASASWSVSLPWLAYNMEVLDAMPSRPWLIVMGSFDDASERNMWMPAVTSNSSSSFVMVGLDGTVDSGVASVSSSDWTIFYDTVATYFTQGRLPAGHSRALFSRSPTSVGAFALDSSPLALAASSSGAARPLAHLLSPSLALYVNPPFPFNRGTGNGSRTAYMRTLDALYPADMLFPLPPSAAVGAGTGAGAGVAGQLQQFKFFSHNDEAVTEAIVPLHLLSCKQCGRSVCDKNTTILQSPQGAVHRTSSGELLLPADLPAVDYTKSTDLASCDVLLGTGISFLTVSSSSQAVVAVSKAYRTQSLVYLSAAPVGGSTSYIVHAISTGLVYAASADLSTVELVPIQEGLTQRYSWVLKPHPLVAGYSICLGAPAPTHMLCWHTDILSATCPGASTDCVHPIQLGPLLPISTYSSFDFGTAA